MLTQFYSCLTLVFNWGWVVNAMPQLLYPWQRAVWLIVREACWAPGWSGWVWRGDNPLPGPGFNPWTVQLYQLHCLDLRNVLKAFDLHWNTDVIGKVRDIRHCSLVTSTPIGGDWSFSCFNSTVVHAISQALCWLWPQKSRFISRLLCVGYVVDSLAVEQIFSEYFTFPLSVIILPVLNTL